ncbi:DJ-1/PfpI family protein [Actinomadura graeca]|uniref:DJ-1/PfpI family protein n=1 Tax=Actinomadura graeca TaxID=2750812 RepID=A0ABX8QSJ4_9ACTN|nr:DJ-1/PfpI family protein [Actinomadura graeca]QXJ21356.1 DJ-1/PfpI family protein [Actinomadura graeca]
MTGGADGPRRVVIVGFPGYRELHVWYPLLRFREEGADVTLAAPDGVRTCEGTLGYPLIPETAVSALDPAGIGTLVLPGGHGAGDAAADPALAEFVRRVHGAGAVVAAVAEGAAVPVAAGVLPASRGAGTGETNGQGPGAENDVIEEGRVIVARDTDALPALVRRLTTSPGPHAQEG